MGKIAITSLVTILVVVLGILAILYVNISGSVINQIPTTNTANTLTTPLKPTNMTKTPTITLTTKQATRPAITHSTTAPKPTAKLTITSITLVKASSAIPIKALNNSNSMMTTNPNANTASSVQDLSPKIAYVKGTFTGGAYNNAFYKFYGEYYTSSSEKNITNDNAHPGFGLNLLTGKIPNYDVGGYNTSYVPFMQLHLKSILPNSTFTILSDQDVHQGLIFNNNGTNAYDIIILGHQEYVTQQEYDNLRSFVNNGGKIIFLDGNVFYAEVRFDASTNSVTLVKGHGWEYDGKVARRTSLERWFNETSRWVGGNYWPVGTERLNFTNNVFDTIHDEETYVNNPNDVIILDYKPYPSLHDIATYELDYGRGSVITIGLYGENVIETPKFDLFFDSLLKGLLSSHPSSYIYQVPIGSNNLVSAHTSVQGVSVPSPPTSLAVYTASSTGSFLTWNPPESDGGSSITGYRIEYSNGTNQFEVLVPNTKSLQTTYMQTGLVPNAVYTYRVSAINSIGVGIPSNTASTITRETTTPIVTSAVAISPTDVRLSWIPPSQTYNMPIIGYKIDQIIGNGVLVSVVDNTGSISTSYTISNLITDKKYTFAVISLFSEGNSLPSPSISIKLSGE